MFPLSAFGIGLRQHARNVYCTARSWGIFGTSCRPTVLEDLFFFRFFEPDWPGLFPGLRHLNRQRGDRFVDCIQLLSHALGLFFFPDLLGFFRG